MKLVYSITVPLSLCLLITLCFACRSEEVSLKKNGIIVKEYGVKWSINDFDDLGQRCYDAVGLQASIGIGGFSGYSDFDAIYPWSQIKRCNIITFAGNRPIITYEGEPGFALDGSNGDVFVRIPKFRVKKYIQNGFEYRIVSPTEGRVHSAFIENGKEIDEIFVSAYEGYIDEQNKLRSIAGVIPTSNVIPLVYLAAAKSNGPNYSLYDMRCVDAIWTLMAVEYGCRNTNRILGYGAADFEQPKKEDGPIVKVEAKGTNEVKVFRPLQRVLEHMPVGSNITICRNNNQKDIVAQRKIIDINQEKETGLTVIRFDGAPINVDLTCFVGSAAMTTNFCETCGDETRLQWHTGRSDFVRNSNMLNPVRYRWMENLVGSLWHYLPDVTFMDLQMYVCPNMSDYQFHKITYPYMPVGDKFEVNWDNGAYSDTPGASYWITSLFEDPSANDYPIGRTYTRSLTSQQGFGGYYYVGDGLCCIATGGGFDHAWRCNMLTHRAWIGPYGQWYLYGARMMFKNLSDISK